MRRYVIGSVIGLAAFLGSALAAEAQVDVNGTGPVSVHFYDSESLYEATVTTDLNFWFHLRVFLNGDTKHYSRTLVIQSGPSYEFSKLVQGMNNWGMAVDDTLLYRGTAIGQGAGDTDDWTVTVEEDPITRHELDHHVDPLPETPIDRHRRFWA